MFRFYVKTVFQLLLLYVHLVSTTWFGTTKFNEVYGNFLSKYCTIHKDMDHQTPESGMAAVSLPWTETGWQYSPT